MKTILKPISILLFLFLVTNCQTSDGPITTKAIIVNETTIENIELTYTSLKISGKIISNGESDILARGVCWSTNPNPTIENDKTQENNDMFVSKITNLLANITLESMQLITLTLILKT